MKTSERYCPERGDIVWLDLDTTKGHEQRGHRPVLVLSPFADNIKSGLCIAAPITQAVRGYPFDSSVPAGLPAKGLILSDQVSSKSWRESAAAYACKAPDALVDDVLATVKTLLR